MPMVRGAVNSLHCAYLVALIRLMEYNHISFINKNKTQKGKVENQSTLIIELPTGLATIIAVNQFTLALSLILI